MMTITKTVGFDDVRPVEISLDDAGESSSQLRARGGGPRRRLARLLGS
jgi:hypothetical protein